MTAAPRITPENGAFPCPCGGRTSVVDSRPMTKETGIRRRRQCTVCGQRFRTYEMRDVRPEIDPIELAIKDGIGRLTGLFDAYLEREEWDET